MRTVFLFLKNALFISDLVKTNYIKEISQRYRVVIFSNFNDEEVSRRLKELGVEQVVWKVQNPRLFAITKFLRTACMHEFDKVSSLRSYYNSPAFRKDKRAKILRGLSWLFAPVLTANFFTRLEMLFMGRSRLFEEYCRKYNPLLVAVATPGIQVFDAEAILLGRRAGIPTLATNLSWDNLTSFKCVRFRRPDYIFAWNEIIKDAAINIHKFDPSKVFVTGSMRFDKYFDQAYAIIPREDFLKSKELNPLHKTILFASGGRAPQQIAILEKIIDARNKGEISYTNILIRPHPFDDPDNYSQFKGLVDVSIDSNRGDFVNMKSTLANTDLNINFKSTITLESFLFDKPVVNFTISSLPFQNKHYFDATSYYAPVIKGGSVLLVTSDDELIVGINKYLADPKQDSQNRQRVANQFFAFRDGLSYKRNVDFIEKIIENKK